MRSRRSLNDVKVGAALGAANRVCIKCYFGEEPMTSEEVGIPLARQSETPDLFPQGFHALKRHRPRFLSNAHNKDNFKDRESRQVVPELCCSRM